MFSLTGMSSSNVFFKAMEKEMAPSFMQQTAAEAGKVQAKEEQVAQEKKEKIAKKYEGLEIDPRGFIVPTG
jgi:hypothetical protein